MPGTGGCSIRDGWALGQTEYQGHALPTRRPAAFCYGFTRNPFDRAVSLWGLCHPAAEVDFASWVRGGLVVRRLQRGLRSTIVEPSAAWLRWADWVGRFETRDEDLAQLAELLGREVPGLHRRRTPRRRRDFRDHYPDDETRELVAAHFAEDLDAFGYEFAPAAELATGAS